jgi:hypothetical protein
MNPEPGANSAHIVVAVFRRHIDIGDPMTFPRVGDWPSANRSIQIKLDSRQYFSILIVQNVQSHMEYLPLTAVKYG